MLAARYQPEQEQYDSVPTSSLPLYARDESALANFEANPALRFPFIQRSKRPEPDNISAVAAVTALTTFIQASKRPEPDNEDQNLRPNRKPEPDADQTAMSRPVGGGKRPVLFPRPPDPDYRFQLLQQWECVVRSVGTHEFVAVLYDLTDRLKAEEEATFPLDDVPPSDLPFLEPGAVFYWSIGYRTSSTGQKDRVSQIRFRRLPTWTASERRDAVKEAAEFEELLGGR